MADFDPDFCLLSHSLPRETVLPPPFSSSQGLARAGSLAGRLLRASEDYGTDGAERGYLALFWSFWRSSEWFFLQDSVFIYRVSHPIFPRPSLLSPLSTPPLLGRCMLGRNAIPPRVVEEKKAERKASRASLAKMSEILRREGTQRKRGGLKP